MDRGKLKWWGVICFLTVISTAVAVQGAITLDFETEDDFSTSLVNGQHIDSFSENGTGTLEFGNLVTITSNESPTTQLGPTIFDSDPTGPNSSGGDPDLLVDLGNVLMLQNKGFSTQTTDGIFDTPNDTAITSPKPTIIFDFLSAVEMLSITMIDINGNREAEVLLIDGSGKERLYFVPSMWTKDVDVDGPLGYHTLDLTITTPQAAEPGATGSDATATEDAGFDPTDVVTVEVRIIGSGAMDNLVFIPEPASISVLVLGSLVLMRRRYNA